MRTPVEPKETGSRLLAQFFIVLVNIWDVKIKVFSKCMHDVRTRRIGAFTPLLETTHILAKILGRQPMKSKFFFDVVALQKQEMVVVTNEVNINKS